MTALVVGLTALSLAACSDDDDAPSAAVSTTTTVADPPTSTTADSTTTTIGAELPDGEHVGYIADVSEMDDGSHWLTFDLAYLLTGDEATAAANAAGVDLDTDYYIQNDNPRVRSVKFASEVVSTIVGEGDACCDSVEVPFGVFLQRVYTASDSDQTTSEGPLMRITIEGGFVTRIDEVYLA